MKKKILQQAVVSATALLVLSACSSSTQTQQQSGNNGFNLSINGKSTYSAKNSRVLDPNASVYKDNLSSDQQLVLEGIIAAAERESVSYKPEFSIDKVSMERIMAIVLLDTPELFYLEPKYSIETNETGEVTLVKFSYSLSGDSLKKAKENLEELYTQATRNFIDTTRSSDVVINSDNLTKFMTEDLPVKFSENLSQSFSEGLASKSMSPYNLNKFISYVLRRNDMPSSIVFGENINTSYGNLAFSKGKKTTEGDETKFEYNDVYSWLLIRAGNGYYHFDPYMNFARQEYLEEKLGFTDSRPISFLWMSDRLVANSREMALTDDVLGVMPTAQSEKLLNYNLNQNNLFSGQSLTELRSYLEEYLKENTNRKSMFIRFKYSNFFDAATQSLTTTLNDLVIDGKRINSFDIYIDPYCQEVFIYNISYNL